MDVPLSKVENQGVEYYSPSENPHGLTYGQWTVKWWQWAFSAPTSTNPLVDGSGANASVHQSGPVWFLAGTFVENFDPRDVPNRKCEIPYGKSILFPVINYEMSPLENPSLHGQDLIKHVKDDIDDIITKDAIVDGQAIPVFRVQSDPPTFALEINADNSVGIPGGNTVSSADGYWVFLKSLSQGKHKIYFHGSCAAGTRCTTANYDINIV